jgi:hypothetical protein
MPFRMQPARFPSGGWPEGYARPPGSDQLYPKGTPVTWDAGNGELDEHALSTTVINIAGVSLDGCSATGIAADPSGDISFAFAGSQQYFVAKLTNGSGTVQTADAANIGVQYGLLKVGTGLDAWFSVDEADTTNVVVEVVDIDTERNVVIFRFLDSAIQVSGSFD